MQHYHRRKLMQHYHQRGLSQHDGGDKNDLKQTTKSEATAQRSAYHSMQYTIPDTHTIPHTSEQHDVTLTAAMPAMRSRGSAPGGVSRADRVVGIGACTDAPP